jgi:hypothetical protein
MLGHVSSEWCKSASRKVFVAPNLVAPPDSVLTERLTQPVTVASETSSKRSISRFRSILRICSPSGKQGVGKSIWLGKRASPSRSRDCRVWLPDLRRPKRIEDEAVGARHDAQRQSSRALGRESRGLVVRMTSAMTPHSGVPVTGSSGVGGSISRIS